MKFERGFRRLTLTISLAAVIVGLLVTAYAIRLTVVSVSGMRAFMACGQDTGLLSNMSTHPETCAAILANSTIPEPFHRLITPYVGEAFFWWEWLDSLLSLFFSMTTESYTLVFTPLIEGIIATTLLGVAPWGMFYLVRWIVQGFTD